MYSGEYSVWFSGCKYEKNVRRWLFKGFEQGIEGLFGEHVDFIDNEYPGAAPDGLKSYGFTQLAYFIYATVGSPVNFHNINSGSFCYFPADSALVARGWGRTVFTVYGLGQYSGYGSFSYPPGAAEKQGMGQMIIFEGILKGPGYMLLPYDIFKCLWTPFACEN